MVKKDKTSVNKKPGSLSKVRHLWSGEFLTPVNDDY